MRAVVLSDNISAEGLKGEWGLSIFIEHNGKKILLDTGASSLYIENAKKIGVDISEIDYGVLSHAHFDHGNGLKEFFEENKKANFYLREGAGENCYFKFWVFSHYIGVQKGVLKEYKDRIVFAEGDIEISEGVTLVPHKKEGLDKIGKKNKMYVKRNGKWYADDFSHEQSLVLETEEGLVIFNSCSHGGADVIINEVKDTFKNKKIYALIGGFHLFKSSKNEVEAMGKRINETGIERVYTGHCTGDKSYEILKSELGEKLHKFKVGLTIEI